MPHVKTPPRRDQREQDEKPVILPENR